MFDIYAKPITMTYRGKEKFRSVFGGLISMIILIFIASIFGYKLRDMINRSLNLLDKAADMAIKNPTGDVTKLANIIKKYTD